MFVFFDAKPAPGAPGHSSTWTTGAKDGIGTAYYDADHGVSHSNVWYTLTRGVLTEVYYPDVAHANLNALQFLMTDASTFVDTELEDTYHQTQCISSHALTYQQINEAKSGKYRITKRYVVNPSAHALLIEVTFEALVGAVGDYQMYLYANPLINNKGTGNSAQVVKTERGIRLTANDPETAFCIGASIPFCESSVGYVGVSDGRTQLLESFHLTETFDVAADGNVALTAQLQFDDPTLTKVTFTLAIGFGSNPEEAITTVDNNLNLSFQSVRNQYEHDWQMYLDGLTPPTVGDPLQYNICAMVLRAHEDKLHPGAFIASLTVPWGDRVWADHGGVGGYHLVWARDFYQVASALALIGDTKSAYRALDYLDSTQQRPDGSFPQNSWLDGTPYWQGIQLDEVAFPILLAHLLQDQSRYETLVKPAANYLLRTGPYSPQERWEENAGYSPSTLASEVASLVAAAEFAKRAGDFAAAAVYLKRADEWAANIDRWTATTTGTLANHPYYIRVSDTLDPDDTHSIEIKNGGGWHPKADVVDAGFLELVRLGIKAPDDELIVQSINVIDKAIRYETSYGPIWYRYNHDGYGEHADGSPYDGSGQGRPWPLLVGERGEYEVALRNAKGDAPVTLHSYSPTDLLLTMASSANQGGLIPEQVWDDEALPHQNLVPGEGTGSATPLAWAMAQYIRLAECIRQNKVVECPTEVRERYVTHPPEAGIPVTIRPSGRVSVVPLTEQTTFIEGMADPGTFIVATLQGTSTWTQTTADVSGRFRLPIRCQRAGLNLFDVIGYDMDRSVSWQSYPVFYRPNVVFELHQSGGSDHHEALVDYPTHPDFKPGDFDLIGLCISADNDNVYFEITLGHLDNPWGGPSGLSKQLIDIYLDLGITEHRETRTMGLNAQFDQNATWDTMIRITGNWHGESHVYGSDWSNRGPVQLFADYARNTVVATVSIAVLGRVPSTGCGVMAFVAGENNGGVRPIRDQASDWEFGGNGVHRRSTAIVDLTVPPGMSRRQLLDDSILANQLPTYRIR